jgi:hypothetical protein
MVSGPILAMWVVIEVLLIRHVHWLHGVYLAQRYPVYRIDPPESFTRDLRNVPKIDPHRVHR